MLINGVVVLYNPHSESVINNISSYIKYLDKLLIIDNSEYKDIRITDYYYNNSKVTYNYLGGNHGIAYALNKGIDFAKENNAEWLLTMDQDSSFLNDDFSKFINYVEANINLYKDGVIFSPIHKVPYLIQDHGIKKVKSAMTSGNLLNISLLDTIGYFDEKLFIDAVDHEFCYRINKKGYSVYRVNEIQLKHNLGDLRVERLLGKNVIVTNHNYVRRYYITRNSLYVRKIYSDSNIKFIIFMLYHLSWSLLTIALYETDKILKFKSVWMGLLDYKRGKFGKKVFNNFKG